MTHNEDMYLSLDSSVSQRWSTARIFKFGATVIGGAAFGFLTATTITPKLQVTSAATSSELLARPVGSTLASLPGPKVWKDVALAAMEATNRCEVGGPKPTPRFTAALAQVSNKDIARMTSKVEAARAERKALTVARAEAVEDDRVGAFPPFGYWDPFGLAAQASEGQLAYFREAELKHGRVCMLATLGWYVQERFHPLFGGDIDVPALQALTKTELLYFWPIILAVTGGIEVITGLGRGEQEDNEFLAPALKEEFTPGDIGFDPLGLKYQFGEDEYYKFQEKELANGRLAMISFLGMISQELVFPDNKLGWL